MKPSAFYEERGLEVELEDELSALGPTQRVKPSAFHEEQRLETEVEDELFAPVKPAACHSSLELSARWVVVKFP